MCHFVAKIVCKLLTYTRLSTANHCKVINIQKWSSFWPILYIYDIIMTVAVKDESGVYMRERAAGLYRLSAYVLAVMTTEFIDVLLTSTIWAIIVYWMVNLMPAGGNFIAHWLVVMLMSFTVQSFGMLISVLMSSAVLKSSLCNCFMFFSLLTSNPHIALIFYACTSVALFR